MNIELIQSDYYEELGKTNFAKDLREEHDLDDLDWIGESICRYGVVGSVSGVGSVIGGSVGGLSRVGGFIGMGGCIGDNNYDI
jgi:hypothetical protein